MPKPLLNIHELIDRTIFLAILRELVDQGYWPDITDTNAYPDEDNFNIEVQNIKSSKGYAIRLNGVGSNQDKGAFKAPSITVKNGTFQPGAAGGDGYPFLVKNGNNYNKNIRPVTREDYSFQIIVAADNISQFRTIDSILAYAIPKMGYVKTETNPVQNIFVEYNGSLDLDDLERGTIERVYQYTSADHFAVLDIEELNAFSSLLEMRIDFGITDQPQALDDEDDDLIVTPPQP